MKIPRREYTAEFKELTVKGVKNGRPVGTVVKELGLMRRRSVIGSKRLRQASSGGKKATAEEGE